MTRAIFAIPGEIDTPTGGYAYARQLLRHAQSVGLELSHWPLPGGFPNPSNAALAETGRRLRTAPSGWPILIDGLALGAMPRQHLESLDTPLVALCHHPLALEAGLPVEQARLLAQNEAQALTACAAVITTSQATADLLVKQYGVAGDLISVVQPGTNRSPRAVGSGSDIAELLSVGSLTPRKGHHILVEALATLRELPWRLTIVGALDRDQSYAANLMTAITAQELQGRINLVGALSDTALDVAYDTADVFVLASLFEGFGMVYTEAMARGLPTIGSETPAIAEATRRVALLAPPGDHVALARILHQIIIDAGARHSLADRCWDAARRFITWQETTNQVTSVLEAVAAGATPQPRKWASE